jgi:hypothetical protein
VSRRKTLSRKKKLALLVGAAALAGGTAAVLAGTSQAAQSPPADRASSAVCTGLATALGNNEQFIAGQRAAPDAQSAARIANREAVIAQIRRQQAASGCDGEAPAGAAVDPAASAPASAPGTAAPASPGGGGRTTGDVVCAGSTVTLSGEGGAPAASSNQFPVGTELRVTNLNNDKSTTVTVTSPSGSCALLNNAAFEQVREPGKLLIRRARIERVG